MYRQGIITMNNYPDTNIICNPPFNYINRHNQHYLIGYVKLYKSCIHNETWISFKQPSNPLQAVECAIITTGNIWICQESPL